MEDKEHTYTGIQLRGADMIAIIAAIDRRHGIGYRGQLLFHIKEDMKRFRDLTMGNAILMGRRTYDSLPHGALPGRRNMVVSRTTRSIPGCEVYGSITDAITAYRKVQSAEDLYIIGGEEIYRQTISLADRLYLTEINATAPHADAFFPEYNDFTCKEEEAHDGYRFRMYEKMNNK